ncbi:MAG: hypothetical protein AAGC46_08300 [Solirubrobacteraceae bacterium]|nr:hypothetical protein [Patulibacter sp.]
MTASELPQRNGHTPPASPVDEATSPADADASRTESLLAGLRRKRLVDLTEPGPLTLRWGLIAVASLVIAGIFTLLYGGAPTYDPWAWIIWGREILHGDLVTTSGPSWKPLPMVFTIPFALFGGAAPGLWMWIARAFAIAGIAAVADLASRLSGRLAAALAAVGIAVAPLYYAYGVQGSSEGMLVLVCCLAATSWLDDRKNRAFWWLVAAALIRPEAWAFVAVLGLERLWRSPKRITWIGAAGAFVIAAWLVPEKIGSGSFMRAASRAHDPNPDSAAFAKSPTLNVLGSMGNLLLWVPLIGVIIAVLLGVIAWRQDDGRRMIEKPVLRVAALLGGVSFVWVAIVAGMTEGGYAGNPRYLAPALGLLVAVGLGGVGWLVRELARRGLAVVGEFLVMAALVSMVLVAALRLPARTEEIIWQKENLAELKVLAKQPGTKAAVLRCGPLLAHPLMVPPIAWTFRLHIDQVLSDDPPPAKGTYIVGTNAHSRPLRPRLDLISGYHQLAATKQIQIVTNCGG